jgi:hypothetical protein
LISVSDPVLGELRELLFNLITDRDERRATVVTTKRAHHATVITTKGKSYRMRGQRVP